MDLEVYTVVHCGAQRWLNYQTSNCSETERCQQQGSNRTPISSSPIPSASSIWGLPLDLVQRRGHSSTGTRPTHRGLLATSDRYVAVDLARGAKGSGKAEASRSIFAVLRGRTDCDRRHRPLIVLMGLGRLKIVRKLPHCREKGPVHRTRRLNPRQMATRRRPHTLSRVLWGVRGLLG